MRTVAALSASLPALLLASLLAAGARAGEPQPGLAEAVAKLRGGDARGAAVLLETITKREPKNAKAWRALGAASKQTKDYPRAIAAFRRAATLDPANPIPLYQIGTVYALEKKPAEAFIWLRKAKATHRIDMTQIDGDAALASLRDDPRFAALHPSPADFEHPFVEPVTIVREWRGEHAGDQFGWIARAIGDVDGDGITDIVTSAPGHTTDGAGGGANGGRVYAYSPGSGKLLWRADGQAGDQLGTGVEGAGDVDGDGVPDVVASAPGSGRAMVYSGRDGHILLTVKGETATDNFGAHVAGAGDVDGDGHADFLVGAPANGAGGKGAGRAYLFSGADGHALLTLTGEHEGDNFGSTVGGASDAHGMRLVVGAGAGGAAHTGRVYVYDSLNGKPRFVLDADATGAALGRMFVCVLGDVNGDGVPDVYASDWSNAANGPSTGRIYVASGADGKTLLTLTGETEGEGFGTSRSSAGDIDGDGAADLIVGSWQYAGAALSGGRARLYSGRDGHLMRTITCRTPGDTFGFDAVGIGDVDHDGKADFLITSGWSGVNGFHSGRVFILSGASK